MQVCLVWTRDPSRLTPRLTGLTGVRWPRCILRARAAKLLIYFACSRCVAAADSSAEEAVPAAAMKAVAGVSLRTFTVYTISDRGRPLVAQRKAL